ncbi:hypothetical protein Hamer_G013342 [Homarus americanus]|uniref:Uncharacterized protein n=1 Tax=Homarus americanus TaxID=6706 RepID=A0A8J5MZU1_HOMAM|nr:hypothetical protein Hamer_G013342 [Homarus americanus]
MRKQRRKRSLRSFELLTAKRLTEAFTLIEHGLAIIDEDDINSDRSLKVNRNVLSAMQCYKEILREKKMKCTQKSLLSYFKKSDSNSPQSSTSPDHSLPQPPTRPYPRLHLSSLPLQLSTTPPLSSRSRQSSV